MRNRLVVITATAAAIAATGAGLAVAGSDDGDVQAKGPGAERARAAALELLPGGTVNAVERDDENGATWEVEVTRADGGTVDVRLDEAFGVVVIEDDREDEGEDER